MIHSSKFDKEDSEPKDLRIEMAELLIRDLQTESSSIHEVIQGMFLVSVVSLNTLYTGCIDIRCRPRKDNRRGRPQQLSSLRPDSITFARTRKYLQRFASKDSVNRTNISVCSDRRSGEYLKAMC